MFKRRSYKKELLDQENIPREALFQNLKELEIINSFLGGHSISIRGLQELLSSYAPPLSLVDIGCGGGDSLKAIARWLENKKISVRLRGIDLKPDCIEYAKSNCRLHDQIRFYTCDFREIFSSAEPVHIIHAALFCHHFTEEELIGFIQLCSDHKAVFMINDLERNPFAYYSIAFLTRLFSKSYLVKNDAPLSVLRGFKKQEWDSILKKAGMKKYIIRKCWAFRHLVIIYPNE
jgi:2-polyprenyl-3-methyl-5-hydroxy-6-metoxy-1,4-benzoquinol methylase